MTPTEFERVRELFHMVRELQPEAQAERLNQACPDNAELRAEVEALLAYRDKSHGLLDVPVRFGTATPNDSAQGPLPKRIGPYSILGLLGEGGMGTVYLAEQEHPRRKVALKLVRSGSTSRAMLRRLEREASILGQLEHPGIARIYEAGVADMQTGDGLNVRTPFFAMEYIRGERLDEHIERANLSTQQRLDLVASICDAVHHAHQQGVVHRDLKPSNILVDQQNRPKILDFGVARVTDADVQTVTLQTATGQLIGTIPYMSPEQVTGVSTNIDTRSDVYSLGVILYELLSGHLPHDVSHMTIPQAVRTIEQEDATPLSSVDKMYRGDIDTIVSKALEKDKHRRYQSASDLAADIRRYLADQPISAHPATTMYQLGKFARRNKALVGGAAATLLALLVGVIGISIQAVRIARERDHAQHAERIAEQRRLEAERSVAIAEAVNAFLNDDLLASVAPEFKGKDVLMRDVLDAASEAIEEKFADSPVVEASIRTTLGNTYKKLGAYGIAEKHLERALSLGRTELGEEHTRTVAAMNNIANLYRVQGRYDEAEPLLLKTLDLRRREFGEEHSYTLDSMNNLANLYIDQSRLDMAETLYAKTLEIRLRLLGEEDPATLVSMNNLAALHDDRGNFDKAEPLYLKTLELRRRVLGEEHPHTVLSMNNLAVMYHNQGRFDEARPLYEKTLELRRRLLGEEHPSTLSSMDNLAILYHRQGRFDEAEELHVKALEVQRRVLGEEHPSTLKTMNNLATVYESQGRFDKAEPLQVKTLEVRLRTLGEEHPRTLISMRNLGLLYRRQWRLDEAEPLLERTLELRRRVYGKDHHLTRRVSGDLLELYKIMGKPDKAKPLVADVLEVYRQQAGVPGAGARELNRYAWELLTCPVVELRDPATAVDFALEAVAATNEQDSGILDTLSLAQHLTGDSNAAAETQRKAIALLPPGPSLDRTDFESSLAKYLLAVHRFAEAKPLLHTLHRRLSEDGSASPSQVGVSVDRLIALYDAWHAAEPGKGYDAKAAEWHAKLPKSAEPAEPAE